jgi:tetratricopeptide (TPR) repeat protein
MGLDIDINYTLDLLTQLQPLNRVSLGARFNLGDGGRAEKSKKVDELYLRGLEEYANGNLDEAVRYWEEALALDKGFDPAREGLQTIKDARALERRIDDIRRLE